MRKLVPFIASIRQPIRTLIFVLLVGLASFGFVSRAVEYIILDREMNRIEEFYRTVGTLVPIDPVTHNNVYEAAELLSGSRFIQFEDRRTITQGVMHDILNPTHGFHTVNGNAFTRGEQPFAYKNLNPFDTIMIMEVESLFTRYVRIAGEFNFVSAKTISIQPGEIFSGHSQFHTVRRYSVTKILDENENTLLDGLEIGGRYLVRAVRQNLTEGTTVDFFPLFDDVYFVSVEDEQALANALEILADEIERVSENSRMLMVTGTKDMTALPLVQSGVYERFQGRFINYEDYTSANHVIVVPQRMDSRRRDARVGETIRLTLRDMRTFTNGADLTPDIQQRSEDMRFLVETAVVTPSPEHLLWALPDSVEAHWANIPAGYWVSIPQNYDGNWQSYPTIEIEVKVIGTYHISAAWNLPRWHHISESFQSTEVFVPASISPEGWGIIDAHVVSGAYSFVLTSPDADVPFMAEFGSTLEYLGFTVQFMGEDPTNFLLSAVPIRNSIRINLLLFSSVLTLVLSLTVFLYLRQRYKEFAILRALGATERNSVWQVVMPVMVFWCPVVIAASVGAWFFALNQAAESLQALAEIVLPADYSAEFVVMNILERMRYEAEQTVARAIPALSLVYLVWLCVGLVLAWFAAVLCGTCLVANKSMISLIQSANSGGAPVRAIKETAPPVGVKMSVNSGILLMSTVRGAGNSIKSVARHHGRHILRAPVKTFLVVGMALLFIVALGWLDRTIVFTEQEIERLYSTTVITGEIVNPGAGIDGAMWGHDIPQSSIDILLESNFISDYYTTSLSRLNMVLPAAQGFLEFSNIRIVTRANPARMDIAKTISDWDTFVREAAKPAAFGVGFGEEFSVVFSPGRGPEDFVFTRGRAAIPIVVHESLLSTNFLMHTNFPHIFYLFDENENAIPNTLSLDSVVLLWDGHETTRAIIIGKYSGGHPSAAYRMGRGLILMPEMQSTRFSTVAFTVCQSKVRYLNEFETEMNELLTYDLHHEMIGFWGVQTRTERYSHEILLNDAEFRMVVVPLEENLNLLRLLYPIAIIMSFVLALGLSMLLMMQNAKNAAITRVLGTARHKTRLNFCAEQLAVYISGIVVGVVVILVLGVEVATVGMLAGIYFTGALIGTITGVLVISHKPPMDLLQVRE
jgi:hypothetical protein